jgi:hypothetical protein
VIRDDRGTLVKDEAHTPNRGIVNDRPWWRWLAIAVAGLTATGFAAAGVFDKSELSVPDFFFGIANLAYAGCGLVLAFRRPRNSVGWILVGMTFFWSTSVAGELFDNRVLTAWAQTAWLPALAMPVTFLPLLFPTGRPPTKRWRWVGWSAGVGLATVFVAGLAEVWTDLRDGVLEESAGPPGVLRIAGASLLLVGSIGSVASFVVRFRRSTGAERQQLKWVLAGVAVIGLGVTSLFTPGVPEWFVVVCLIPLPVAIMVAVLRYRLYEIDRLISRTFTYALLVAVLAAVYATGVVGLQAVLPVEGSDLAVAGSTLAAFALFQPVRRRVQGLVDRRFDRGRYSAGRVIEDVASKLREQTDLAAVRLALVSAVDKAMHPDSATLWIRET